MKLCVKILPFKNTSTKTRDTSKKKTSVRFKDVDAIKEEASKEEHQVDTRNDIDFEARNKIEKMFEK